MPRVVNTWYSGAEAMTRTSPMCRAERGCNETMILRGLTDFMETIKKIYEGNEDNSAGTTNGPVQ